MSLAGTLTVETGNYGVRALQLLSDMGFMPLIYLSS